MTGKLKVLGLVGIGYVLGARAGRERYEQIAAQAQRVARNPKVRRTTEQAKNLATDKATEAGNLAAQKAGDAVTVTKEKVQDMRSSDQPTTGLGAGLPGIDADSGGDRGGLGGRPEGSR